jgi:hypothetical protein
MKTIIAFLFRCRHSRLSSPFTPRSVNHETSETYVVCLDCGKKFPYDWEKMRRVDSIPRRWFFLSRRVSDVC